MRISLPVTRKRKVFYFKCHLLLPNSIRAFACRQHSVVYSITKIISKNNATCILGPKLVASSVRHTQVLPQSIQQVANVVEGWETGIDALKKMIFLDGSSVAYVVIESTSVMTHHKVPYVKRKSCIMNSRTSHFIEFSYS